MRQVAVIAGPSGSGKDVIIRDIVERYKNVTRLVTATTRTKRSGERDGIDYYFMTSETFVREIEAGNILEYYYRSETDTYYGTYKPDIDTRIATGKIVLCQLQIVGAKYFKEHCDAVTIFILPPSLKTLDERVRTRSVMSTIELEERRKITQQEIEKDASWYDYRVINEDGKLREAADKVVEILTKEGYTFRTS